MRHLQAITMALVAGCIVIQLHTADTQAGGRHCWGFCFSDRGGVRACSNIHALGYVFSDTCDGFKNQHRLLCDTHYRKSNENMGIRGGVRKWVEKRHSEQCKGELKVQSTSSDYYIFADDGCNKQKQACASRCPQNGAIGAYISCVEGCSNLCHPVRSKLLPALDKPDFGSAITVCREVYDNEKGRWITTRCSN